MLTRCNSRCKTSLWRLSAPIISPAVTTGKKEPVGWGKIGIRDRQKRRGRT